MNKRPSKLYSEIKLIRTLETFKYHDEDEEISENEQIIIFIGDSKYPNRWKTMWHTFLPLTYIRDLDFPRPLLCAINFRTILKNNAEIANMFLISSDDECLEFLREPWVWRWWGLPTREIRHCRPIDVYQAAQTSHNHSGRLNLVSKSMLK